VWCLVVILQQAVHTVGALQLRFVPDDDENKLMIDAEDKDKKDEQ
jgi:hypothetical protein